MPVVVDSSGWIEYVVDGINASCFAKFIENPETLVVPSITLTEVYRWMLRETSEANALSVVALMKEGAVVPLDDSIAILAADVSHRNRLPLADGIIYATARRHEAEVITQDADLEGLEGVRYVRHPKRKG